LSVAANAQPAAPPAPWRGEEADRIFGLMQVWGPVRYAFPHLDRLETVDGDQTVQDCVPRVLEAGGRGGLLRRSDGARRAAGPDFEHEQAHVDFEALIDHPALDSIEGIDPRSAIQHGGSTTVSEPVVACLVDEAVATPIMKFRHNYGARTAWGQGPQWHTVQGEIHPRNGRRYRRRGPQPSHHVAAGRDPAVERAIALLSDR
jgi:hypothetical protein